MTVSQQIIKQYTIYVHCGLTLNRFSLKYTTPTIKNLSHIHTYTYPHTPRPQSRTSLTFIHTLIHIHHTHNQEPLSHSFTHSSTFTITELN